MKNKSNFLFLIGVVSACSILFSCGNDEDKKPEPHKIIGTWTFSSMDYETTVNGQDFITFLVETYGVTEAQAEEIVDQYLGDDLEDEFQGSITFKEDGTYQSNDGTSTETGTYSLDSSETNLTINPDDEDEDSIVFDVTEFTNNNLSLEYSMEYEEDITEDGESEEIEILMDISLTK